MTIIEDPISTDNASKPTKGSSMSERIVFMGTPEFASGCLKALVEAKMNVVAVVTMPDKPIGRGHKMGMSEVKKTALDLRLPLMQPQNLKDPDFLQELRSYEADLQIVVAFRMLPEAVWAMPRLGTFNLHASLLPKYRGAAPIQRAIWNGETESGVTTFLLDKDMATGAILYQEKIILDSEETAGTLHDRLLAIGAPLVVKTAKALFDGSVQAIPQPIMNGPIPDAPKIFKKDCILDFSQPAYLLHRQVKALSPYPAAITYLHNARTGETIPVKVLESRISTDFPKSYEQGSLISDGKHFFGMACSDASILYLEKIQLPGKKALTIKDFLRGFRPENPNSLSFSKVMNN